MANGNGVSREGLFWLAVLVFQFAMIFYLLFGYCDN